MKIIWNGTSLVSPRSDGYSVAENEICARLQTLGIDFDKECLVPNGVKSIISAGIGLSYQSDDAVFVESDILINNRLPIDYSKCNGYNIGFSYWETNRLPSEWVDRMNQMDEIWTTSKWAKQVFIDSGVTVPVFAFNLGVHPEFKPEKRSLKTNTFTFMSIGSPSTRKNSQLTVDAFLKLFEGRDDVRLLYKSIDSPDARLKKGSEISSIFGHPQIDVVEADLSVKQLSDLYDSADCLVYPTSGEGWGMLPFQSISKGIPTICTNATACTEYAGWSVPLDYKWSEYNISGIYSNSGDWAEPNFDDLCDKMLYVYNNYDEISEFTYNNAIANYSNITWDAAAEGYYNRLCQISKNLVKH
jgi:glycosyltransferase involved in cell wall biosynthesis